MSLKCCETLPALFFDPWSRYVVFVTVTVAETTEKKKINLNFMLSDYSLHSHLSNKKMWKLRIMGGRELSKSISETMETNIQK